MCIGKDRSDYSVMSMKESLKECYRSCANWGKRVLLNLKSDVHIGVSAKIRFSKIAPKVRIGAYSNISGG